MDQTKKLQGRYQIFQWLQWKWGGQGHEIKWILLFLFQVCKEYRVFSSLVTTLENNVNMAATRLSFKGVWCICGWCFYLQTCPRFLFSNCFVVVFPHCATWLALYTFWIVMMSYDEDKGSSSVSVQVPTCGIFLIWHFNNFLDCSHNKGFCLNMTCFSDQCEIHKAYNISYLVQSHIKLSYGKSRK